MSYHTRRAAVVGLFCIAIAVVVTFCAMEVGEEDERDVSRVTAAAFSLSGGFRIRSDKDPTLFWNAYGGAHEGGEVRLWKNCPTSNPACMWKYVNGLIVSMHDPDLAVTYGGGNGTPLTLTKRCFEDPTLCTWTWTQGLIQATYRGSMKVKASGSTKHEARLVTHSGCKSTYNYCRWTLEKATILSGANSKFGVNAYGGAAQGNYVKLWENCPVSNGACTWTFREGRIWSDHGDGTMAMNAWGGAVQGANIRLWPNCPIDNTSCTWSLVRGTIQSGASSGLRIRVSGGASHTAQLVLDNACSYITSDCLYDIGPRPPYRANLWDRSVSLQKEIPINLWENTLLVVPANRAGCNNTNGVPNGAVFIGEGDWGQGTTTSIGISRYDLGCMTNAGSTCPGTPITLAPSPPAGAEWASDPQIVRLSNGTILMSRQMVLDASGANPRGAEYMVQSQDCGNSWGSPIIMDPATDSPAGLCNNTTTQSGHDRPELYADPYNPGRVYMTVLCGGTYTGCCKRALYRSDDSGSNWTFESLFPIENRAPAYMTTTSNGILYIAQGYYSNPDGKWLIGLLKYDPDFRGMLSNVMPIKNIEWARIPNGPKTYFGSEGISRVGSFTDGDYLRVHYNYKDTNSLGQDSYNLLVVLIKVSTNNVLTEIDTQFVTPGPGRAIVGATSIETDRLEWKNNREVNPAIIYWYDINIPSVPGNWGPASLRYLYLPAAGYPLSSMSLGREPPRLMSNSTWPVYNDIYGDYQKGAFWANPGVPDWLFFMALWGEQPSAAASHMRTNYVGVPVWD